MIIVCETCTAKFNLDESLLSQNGSRVRCSQCGHLFLAFPKGYGQGKDIHPADKAVPHTQNKTSVEEQQVLSGKPSVPMETHAPQKEINTPTPMGTDDIDFDTGLELDFSNDEFDFDESDLDLNLDLGDLTGDETAPAFIKDDALPRDTTHELDADDDFTLELDLDMDDDVTGDDPLAAVMEDDALPRGTTHELDADDDFTLELDLDMDDVTGDDPLAAVMEDDALPRDTTHELDADDDFTLELDLDMEDDVTGDDPLAAVMEDDALPRDTTHELDADDDFTLELDLDMDDDVTGDDLSLELDFDMDDDVTGDDLSLELDFDMDDDVTGDDLLADILENKTQTRDTADDLDTDDDFSLELDLDMDDLSGDDPLADMLEKDTQTQDTANDLDDDDDLSLEMDLDKSSPMPAPDDKEPPVIPPEKIQPTENKTEQTTVKEKATITESGDDIPIVSTPPMDDMPGARPSDTEKKSSFIVKLFLFFIFILIFVLGAHAASLMTGISIPFISDLKIPFLTELITPPPPPPPPVQLVPDKKTINGRFATNQKEGILFVVAGNIRNPSQVTCTNVKVTVTLLNTDKVKINSKTVVCGTTISDQQLTTLDMVAINGLLSDPAAQNQSSLAPGQTSPFMVVFSKLPDNLENFTVTVKDFDHK